MDLTEKTIGRKTVYKGKITEYVLEDVQLPDGSRSQREIVLHDAASAVLPILQNGKGIFVKQFRKAIGQELIEIPAGLIDPDDSDPLGAAKRELLEETGYEAEKWKKITSFYSSPGFTNEYLTLYEARELKKKAKELDLDEGEFLEVLELTFDEAWKMYEADLIQDAKTVFALYFWRNRNEW